MADYITTVTLDSGEKYYTLYDSIGDECQRMLHDINAEDNWYKDCECEVKELVTGIAQVNYGSNRSWKVIVCNKCKFIIKYAFPYDENAEFIK